MQAAVQHRFSVGSLPNCFILYISSHVYTVLLLQAVEESRMGLMEDKVRAAPHAASKPWLVGFCTIL